MGEGGHLRCVWGCGDSETLSLLWRFCGVAASRKITSVSTQGIMGPCDMIHLSKHVITSLRPGWQATRWPWEGCCPL